jgi:hypothetical protein
LFVAPPSITRSVSRNAASSRERACSRVAPLAITLAMSESNAAGTVLPATTPVSMRTLGPSAGSKRAIGPGAGRNP